VLSIADPQREFNMNDTPKFRKLTPVLYCEAIEACLPFWVDTLGFTVGASIPAGDRLGFVMLAQNSVEVMLQSYASLAEDMPKLVDGARGQSSYLFLEVENLDVLSARLGSTEVVMPRRQTFYGSTEIGVRSPGGHFITLAEMNLCKQSTPPQP
jgi:uncharacterized glyoxalase superfamily protein PhnB